MVNLEILMAANFWRKVALKFPIGGTNRYFPRKCDQTFTQQNLVLPQRSMKNCSSALNIRKQEYPFDLSRFQITTTILTL